MEGACELKVPLLVDIGLRATTGGTRSKRATSCGYTLSLSWRGRRCGSPIALLLLSANPGRADRWREYPAFEYNDFPIPPDYQEKTEWAFARLMYPNAAFAGGFGRRGRFGGDDWRQGGRGIFWTMDYPRSDRHFSVALRRLTRIHARSVEEPVNLDEGYQYNWPWLYGVEVGHWDLTDAASRAAA